MMSVVTTLLREELLHGGDYEDYYDDGGYGDYGTEEAEAEDYYEEEVESIDFDF